jgi:hypothetical protein
MAVVAVVVVVGAVVVVIAELEATGALVVFMGTAAMLLLVATLTTLAVAAALAMVPGDFSSASLKIRNGVRSSFVLGAGAPGDITAGMDMTGAEAVPIVIALVGVVGGGAAVGDMVLAITIGVGVAVAVVVVVVAAAVAAVVVAVAEGVVAVAVAVVAIIVVAVVVAVVVVALVVVAVVVVAVVVVVVVVVAVAVVAVVVGVVVALSAIGGIEVAYVCIGITLGSPGVLTNAISGTMDMDVTSVGAVVRIGSYDDGTKGSSVGATVMRESGAGSGDTKLMVTSLKVGEGEELDKSRGISNAGVDECADVVASPMYVMVEAAAGWAMAGLGGAKVNFGRTLGCGVLGDDDFKNDTGELTDDVIGLCLAVGEALGLRRLICVLVSPMRTFAARFVALNSFACDSVGLQFCVGLFGSRTTRKASSSSLRLRLLTAVVETLASALISPAIISSHANSARKGSMESAARSRSLACEDSTRTARVLSSK